MHLVFHYSNTPSLQYSVFLLSMTYFKDEAKENVNRYQVKITTALSEGDEKAL